MTKKVITGASQDSKGTHTVPNKVDPALLACNEERAPEAGKHDLATEILPVNPEAQPSLAGNLWRALPGGWSYERDSRYYMLTWPEPGTLILDLEARVGVRRYWRRMDPSMAYCRAEFAQEISPADPSLRREIRRDLFIASCKLRFDLIDLELRRDSDDVPIQLADIFVTGLELKIAGRIVEMALRAGAMVRRRARP